MDPNAKAILEMVHSFYVTAWGQLIAVGAGLIVFLGLIIPWVYHRLQRKEAQLDQKELELLIDTGISAARIEVSKNIQKEISEIQRSLEMKIIELEVEIDTVRNKASGSALHIQGMMNYQEELFFHALYSYLGAANGYLLANDQMNLRKVIEAIHSCLLVITKDQLIWEGEEDLIQNLIDSLRKKNTDRQYSDLIQKISAAKRSAEERDHL